MEPDRLTSFEARDLGRIRILQGNWSTRDEPTAQSCIRLEHTDEIHNLSVENEIFSESFRCFPINAEITASSRISLFIERLLQPTQSTKLTAHDDVIPFEKGSSADYTLMTPSKNNRSKVLLSGGLTQFKPFSITGMTSKTRGTPKFDNRMGIPNFWNISNQKSGHASVHLSDQQDVQLLHPVTRLVKTRERHKIHRTTTIKCQTSASPTKKSTSLKPESMLGSSLYQATFWIYELDALDRFGDPILKLQYLVYFSNRDVKPQTTNTLCVLSTGTLHRVDQWS